MSNPEYCIYRANEVMQEAERCGSASTRAALVQIAESYMQLAQRLETAMHVGDLSPAQFDEWRLPRSYPDAYIQ